MPPPNDEVLQIQSEVFEDEIQKEISSEKSVLLAHGDTEGISRYDESKKMFAFIVENSPIFRLFTEDLSPEARAIWDRYAKGETGALQELEEHYDSFRVSLETWITQLDPDVMTELSNAIEEGNVDEASRIIETNAHLRTKEERE